MMRAVALSACLLAFLPVASPCIAQEDDAQVKGAPKARPAVVPSRTARITGTVLCADTHRPARGAMLMITPVPSADGKESRGGTEAFARVAADGTYTGDHLGAGEYSVIAMLPGYLSPVDTIMTSLLGDRTEDKMRAAMRQAGTVTVRANETGHYDITLQRGAAVSGRVLFSDGSPASQVTLDIQDVNAKPADPKSPEGNINLGAMMRTFFMHQSQGTDDQGHFRISGLTPGTYRVAVVQASNDPFGGMRGDEGMAAVMGIVTGPTDLRIYSAASGETFHKKQAKTYNLRSGDEVTDIDITIPADAFHRVQGRISALDGRPINSAAVILSDAADDSLAFHASLQNDGSFLFPAVPAGTYKLTATGARIGALPEGVPDNQYARESMLTATSAFADGSAPLIVKDSDVSDINLPLTEVPLPKGADKPKLATPVPDGEVPAP